MITEKFKISVRVELKREFQSMYCADRRKGKVIGYYGDPMTEIIVNWNTVAETCYYPPEHLEYASIVYLEDHLKEKDVL